MPCVGVGGRWDEGRVGTSIGVDRCGMSEGERARSGLVSRGTRGGTTRLVIGIDST